MHNKRSCVDMIGNLDSCFFYFYVCAYLIEANEVLINGHIYVTSTGIKLLLNLQKA